MIMKDNKKRGKMKIRKFNWSIVLTILLCLSVSSAWAEKVRGVTDTEIKLGFMTDQSGPGKYACFAHMEAAKDAVAWVNDTGGINGRKINLIIEDNGLMPTSTMNATRKLIFKDDIFALAFNLGSAGSRAIIPLCEENKIVMMPHGANKDFYSPGNKWVFVPHTVQHDMAARAAEYILEKNSNARIGVIYQDDDFGKEGVTGARAAAKYYKTTLAKEASYKTGTVDFSPHMAAMKDAKVDAILLWTYLPQSAAIIKERAKMDWKVDLISDNTTISPALFSLVGGMADGYMIITPYAPHDALHIPGVKRVRDINKKYGNPAKTLADPTFNSYHYLAVFGYMEAMIEGLRRAGRDLNPESLIKGLESIKNHDMGGLCPNITFGPKQHVSSFSSMVFRADAKTKRFDIIDPIKEPKSVQK
jgi:branched-chain amino acid transport system substrate-binding protein